MKSTNNYLFKVLIIVFVLTSIVVNSQSQTTDKDSIILDIKSEKKIDNYFAGGLNDWITVHIDKLKDVLEKSEKGKSLVLFINGMPLVDCRAIFVDTNKNELRFLLKRTDSTKIVWDAILKRPNAFTKDVQLSIGPKNGPPIQCNANNFKLIIIRKWQFWIFVPFFILFLFVIYLLSKRTNFLRDAPTKDTSDANQRTFSLARSQMLFWTILVLVSFVFMWVATGDINTITSSILVLLGISSATALGARAIDNMPLKSSDVEGEKTTGSYWKDILGGRNSFDGIHRLQIIVWTIILGFIFICSVWTNMAMPEFNDTLLTLMGISSGTYIGFKLNE